MRKTKSFFALTNYLSTFKKVPVRFDNLQLSNLTTGGTLDVSRFIRSTAQALLAWPDVGNVLPCRDAAGPTI